MSGDLLARHRTVLPSWLALYYEQPIELVRGDGRYVWDADGNRYLDCFGGILTTLSGHSVPEVVRAVQEQATRILHTSTLYLSRPAVELAERIAQLAPVPDAKVFLANSGTEAIDTALLLATTYRRSNQVLALRNSYHGRSFGAVAITGNRGWSPSSLSPIQVSYVHGGYRYRSPWRDLDDDAYIAACVDDLRDVLATATAGDVACLIVEPIQGVGGFSHPPDGLFAAYKEICDETGILMISDEVQTGWGRTGEHFWGIDAHDVQPDMITFAKGLGNGLAVGGVVARAEVMDCLQANSISTFGGNPLAAAGALANLDYLLSNDLQANAAKVGRQLLDGIRDLAADRPAVGDVRGKGLMIGVELVRPGSTDRVGGLNPPRPPDPDPDAAAHVLETCRDHGVLIGKGGLWGNVLRIAPPLSINPDEADEALDAFGTALPRS